jgi:tRNA dimethylallyltransferase
MIIILGPTATGKTKVAVQVALKTNGEIISADSRQVFRGMNIGTGKDLDEYTVGNQHIPYHLIDIAEPGEEYSVFRFQQDFLKAYHNITKRGKTPILCGGTGFYMESVLKQYRLDPVPENPELRKSLATKTDEELIAMLASMRKLHNKTDIEERSRLIRIIEIDTFYLENPNSVLKFPEMNCEVFGITFEREIIRQRITSRLEQRLQEGMIEEVQNLLQQGVSPQRLCSYGLEYKFVTQYIKGELSKQEMFRLLNIAIHQFAKRQMTWFRKMEREGINIQWINSDASAEEKAEMMVRISKQFANKF